jgi:hypothetical protein
MKKGGGAVFVFLQLWLGWGALLFAQIGPPPPFFSHEGGFYGHPFFLNLTAQESQGVVLYTLDGSEPHPDNLIGARYTIKLGYRRHPHSPEGAFRTDSLKTNEYTQPLWISDNTHLPDRYSRINTTWDEAQIYAPFSGNPKGVVVRARTVWESGAMSEVVTQSFFVQSHQRFIHDLPVVSVSIDADRLFSYEDGIYVAGQDFDRWREENPTESAQAFSAANYTRRGDETESAGVFEFFEDNQRGLAQQVGFRIHGGATRSFPQKSLRIYARNEYESNLLSYPLFKESEHDAFRRVVLRNNGDDFLRGIIRDRVHHRLAGAAGIEMQHDRAVVAYINAEYWGLMALRERIDRNYLDRRFGLNGFPVDLLSNDMQVEEGSAANYMQMMSFVANSDMSASENYARLATMMDIDNFIRYVVAQMYISNTDWPHNNIRYWRSRTPRYLPEGGPGKDGRWRWIFFDTDIGSLGNRYEIDMVAHMTSTGSSPDWSTMLFRRLLENPEFRHDLLNRFAEVMNQDFSYSTVVPVIDRARDEINSEVPFHITRWRRPVSYAAWQSSVDEMKHFFEKRPEFMKSHLISHFGLEGMAEIRIDRESLKGGHLQIHNTRIFSGSAESLDPVWSGEYFAGIPVLIAAVADSGYRFVGWSGSVVEADSVFYLSPEVTQITLTPEFEVYSTSISEGFSDGTSVNVSLSQNSPNPFNPITQIKFEVKHYPEGVRLSVYDILGREVAVLKNSLLSPGNYVVSFDASGLSSGMYMYVLESKSRRETRIMTLLK